MTDVVIPVKDLSKAKGRLQSVLNPEERSGLVLAMLRDLLMALRDCDLGEVWIVASDGIVFDLCEEFGARVIRETESQGYNRAVATGLQAVNARRSVIVLPADLPLTQPQDIVRLTCLRASNAPFVGIVPDRHNRGTNGLFLSEPDLIAPAFGAHSFTNHKAAATKIGVAATVFPLNRMAVDIDCADDLFALSQSGNTGAATNFLNSIAFRQPLVKQQKIGAA